MSDPMPRIQPWGDVPPGEGSALPADTEPTEPLPPRHALMSHPAPDPEPPLEDTQHIPAVPLPIPVSPPPSPVSPGYLAIDPMSVLPLSDPTGESAGAPVVTPPPRRRRGGAVPVLAGVSAVLLVTTLALAALLVTGRGDLGQTRAELAASRQAATAQTAQLRKDEATIAGLRDDVAAVRTDLTATERELRQTKAQLGDTKDQLGDTKTRLGATEADKQTVSDCLRLILEYFDAAGRGDDARAQELLRQANAPCQAADKIVNP
jgi:hypothetical protein